MPLVQGHDVVFTQNKCYTRKEDYLLYLKKCLGQLCSIYKILGILIRMRNFLSTDSFRMFP